MLLKVLVGVAGVVLAVAAIVASRPSEYRVARTTTINAPAASVFAHINDFHKWNAWNPWAKIDPAMKQGFEGAASGVGAVQTWAGNHEVGEGRMTITESRPNDLVGIRLDFAKPFRGTSHAQFSLRPDGDRTIVTWSMEGDKNFIAKAIHMVMDMDKMIGGNFEKGLADMKAVVEATPRS